MADDPWEVVSTKPSSAAPAADDWSVVKTAPAAPRKPPAAPTLTDIVGRAVSQAGKDFAEPFVQYGQAEGRSLKDINEGLGGMAAGVGRLNPKQVATGAGQALKGDVMSLLNQFGLVGALMGGAPLHAVSAPIKRKTGIDLEQAMGAAMPEKGAALGAAEAAQEVARAPSLLGGAIRQFLPSTRAASRFLKAAPAAPALARAQAARAAGVEPSVVGVVGRPGLRLARTAKTVSPEAEAAINEHAETHRAQAAQEAADRIQSEAPYGHEAVADAKARLEREQDTLAREQYREPYSQEVEAPDRVLEVMRTPKTQSEIASVIDTEVERAAHPERYPDAAKNVEQLRDLQTYNKRRAEWEAAKAKYEQDLAAYEAEAKKVGAEGPKAQARYEKQVAAAKAKHETALRNWENRRAAHDKKPFSQEDFTGKVKPDDLRFLNKAEVLSAKPGSPTAQVRDAMFETYGFKERRPFDEPEPVLELPKAPKTVSDLKAPTDPGPPPARPRVSGAALDRLRIGLRDRGRALYDTDRGLGGALGEHAKAIDEAMDGEGFEHLGPARAQYREFETRKALLDIPATTLLKSPANFRVAVSKALKGHKMTDQMRADLTHALVSGLAEQAGKNPNTARQIALQFLRGGNFKRNISPILGSENTAKVQTAMREVVSELAGLDYILGGSATADKQADKLREGFDMTWGAMHSLHGNPAGALHSFARVIQRRLTNMSEAEANEVARFFSEGKSPEEVYAELEALVNSGSIPKRAPPHIRGILTRAIGAQAVSNLGRLNPDRDRK